MLDQITDLRVTDGKIEEIINSEKGSRVAGEALYYLMATPHNLHLQTKPPSKMLSG